MNNSIIIPKWHEFNCSTDIIIFNYYYYIDDAAREYNSMIIIKEKSSENQRENWFKQSNWMLTFPQSIHVAASDLFDWCCLMEFDFSAWFWLWFWDKLDAEKRRDRERTCWGIERNARARLVLGSEERYFIIHASLSWFFFLLTLTDG